jgi:UTP--glucose-1-phosphate uridylyltransferase
MLPVVDRPALQYVIEEAVAAGLDDLLVINWRGKRAIEDHFDRHPELEEALAAKGDHARLSLVESLTSLAALHYVRQIAPLGLGHAVLCAESHVGDQPFAVLLGDDLIDAGDPLLARMLDVQRTYGGSVIALIEVDASMIQAYGCAAVKPTDEGDVVRVTGLVEKPKPDEAPSNLALIGRYVLAPEVFAVLRETPPGHGGELQLTDALRVLAERDDRGGPVHGVLFKGRRFDTGDRGEWLRTVVTLAVEREDLGPDLLEWLRDFVASHPPGWRPNSGE